LRLVKLFHRACTKFLTGSLAHPTVTKRVLYSFEAKRYTEYE